MIDVKQLRYGSIVADKHGFQFEVVGIFKDQILCDFEGNEGDVFEFKPSEVFGVPLTEEWLVKLSFEFAEDLLAFSSTEVPVTFANGVAEIGYAGQKNYKVQTQYVHQLMNLVLDLTGTELKAKEI